MQTNTDEKTIEDILTRGVEQVFPDKEKLQELLLSGKRIKLYCGFDPTASSLHIGNAIQINKLAQFQKLGHRVIFLIGDFTALIGDPTDKTAVRQTMTRKQVLENCKNYKKQAEIFLNFEGENPAEILYNSEWSDNLLFKDLIGLASNFTAQQMLKRDMFEKRLKDEKPIYLHEFLYPLAQAYDSVVMDVDLELGGNDQMFNMMCGRDLQKAINKKEKFVLTLKLLADEDGQKMGKTEGNAVFLDQEPNDIYGAIMSWPDGFIANTFELITNMPMEEIAKMRIQIKEKNVNPKDLKMKLARELVEIFHGKEKAINAEKAFVEQFQTGVIPEDIKEIAVNNGMEILDLLVEIDLVKSKGEARRKIDEGAVKIDDEKITDQKFAVNFEKETKKIIKLGRKMIKIAKK